MPPKRQQQQKKDQQQQPDAGSARQGEPEMSPEAIEEENQKRRELIDRCVQMKQALAQEELQFNEFQQQKVGIFFT